MGFLRGLVMSIVYGPVGRKPGVFPEKRAAVGFRAGLACMVSGSLTFASLSDDLQPWVRNAFTPYLPIVTLLCVHADLGDVTKFCIQFGLGATFMTLVGTFICAFCFLIGGFKFVPLILAAAIPITNIVLVLLSNIAALIQAPRPLLFVEQSSCFWAVLPLAAFLKGGEEIKPLLQFMTSFMSWFTLASIIAYWAALLPFGIGALTARRTVTSHLAAVVKSLAEHVTSLAATRRGNLSCPANASDLRHRRHEVLVASASLRVSLKVAALERCGSYYGQSESTPAVVRSAEVCRIALNLQQASKSIPYSSLTEELHFRGPLNDGVLDLKESTAKTLNVAASLLTHLAGHKPLATTVAGNLDANVPMFADAQSCRLMAEECQAQSQRFRRLWIAWSAGGWRTRLQEISAEHATKIGRTDAEANARGLPPHSEVCGASASHLGATSAAEAAAAVAVASAQLAEDLAQIDENLRLASLCWPFVCLRDQGTGKRGSIGLRAWLFIPFAGPRLWWAGIKKGAAFAVRQGVAMGVIALIVAVAPPHFFPKGGLWALLTAGICVTPVLGAAVLKSLRRLVGTFLGALVAVPLIQMAHWEYSSLWVWIGVIAFIVKFFEPELQYGGTVFFLTVCVIFTGAVENKGQFREVFEIALYRVVEISVGVIMAGIVSVFIAPTRATTQLRSMELEALSCSAFVLSAVSKSLFEAIPVQHKVNAGMPRTEAANFTANEDPEPSEEALPLMPLLTESGENETTSSASSSDDDESDDAAEEAEDGEGPGDGDMMKKRRQPGLQKLRNATWDLMDSFFFGGDGLAHGALGSTLVDSQWESRFCTDAGYEFLWKTLWLPAVCCPCLHEQAAVPGHKCLDAVQAISSLMRQSHILAALAGAGFGGGGKVLLAHSQVFEALGPAGEALAAPFQAIALACEPLLSSQGNLQRAITCKLLKDGLGNDHWAFARIDALRRRGLAAQPLAAFAASDAFDLEELESAASAWEVAVTDLHAGLEEAKHRVQLLMDGSKKGRDNVLGEAITMREAGKPMGGSTHRVAVTLFMIERTLENLEDIIMKLTGGEEEEEAEDAHMEGPSLHMSSARTLGLREDSSSQTEDVYAQAAADEVTDAVDGEDQGGWNALVALC